MESPLHNPPHVSQNPQTVFAVVWGLVSKAVLIALYPEIGLGLREVDAAPLQRRNEIPGVQVLVALRIPKNRLPKGIVDV